MSFGRTLALSLLLGLVAPATARGDFMIIPFLGVNFAGHSAMPLADAINAERIDWGVSLAYMGAGILGFEGDIGYSPDFFGQTDIGGSSVLTATGNLLLGIPIGGQSGIGFRPYALVGAGVIRSEIDAFGEAENRDMSKAGWDVGGGAMFFFGSHVGLRTDVRYFRTFGDVGFDRIDVTENPRTLEFARASAGFILRF